MKKSLLAAGIAALALAAAVPAQAAMQFKFVSGATTVVVTDNGAGDLNPAVGQVTFSGSVGNFSAVISTGVSNSPGSATGDYLQVNHISIRDTTNTAATLTITLGDNGFSLPTGNGTVLGSSFAGTFLSGTPGESVSFQSYADPSNTLLSTSGTAVTTGLQSATLAAGSQLPSSFKTTDASTTFNASGPYSVTNVAVINLSAGGQINIAGTTTISPSTGGIVPEPASIGILGSAGLLLLARRRRA